MEGLPSELSQLKSKTGSIALVLLFQNPAPQMLLSGTVSAEYTFFRAAYNDRLVWSVTIEAAT